ncbi:class I SAM-dependent methyltransferase [Rhodobacteraceae bacterium NNCM2]|nr:class I SAM-dependent methyltransferase [Coraliihabitans acroporae]
MRFLPRLFRAAVKTGDLTLVGPGGETHRFGDGTPPAIRVRLADASLDWKIVLNPELRAAEAYMEGGLVVEEGGIDDFIRLFFRNKRHFDLTPGQIFWKGVARRMRRWMQHNPVSRSRRNVAHHYDLGNEFYRLWLDRDMQYSCAYFDGTDDLEAAQTLKKRHIAAKLALKPGQRVLDIGCGWGGMALYLASVAEVEVLGVTLSEEQLAAARHRAEALGLTDRCRFELRDYREVTETFDRVVSVGMAEHVGVGYLDQYFLSVRDRLGPDGVALIHAITTKAPPGVTGPFLRKYIFPGGYAPSMSETFASIERSGLWTLDCEIWRVHYANTLAAWWRRFQAVRPKVVEMYDERFARMFEVYLSACECAFSHGPSCVFQIQLGRERDGVPLTRDYIAAEKAALAERERDVIEGLLASTERAL